MRYSPPPLQLPPTIILIEMAISSSVTLQEIEDGKQWIYEVGIFLFFKIMQVVQGLTF